AAPRWRTPRRPGARPRREGRGCARRGGGPCPGIRGGSSTPPGPRGLAARLARRPSNSALRGPPRRDPLGAPPPGDALRATPPRDPLRRRRAAATRQPREQIADHVLELRTPDLLELVADPHCRLPDRHEPCQVYRRGDDDDVALARVDRRFHVLDLLLRIPHGGEERPDRGVLPERVANLPDEPRTRIDDLSRSVALRRDDTGAVFHVSVRERGAVLDHERPSVPDELRLVDGDGGGRVDHDRVGVDLLNSS